MILDTNGLSAFADGDPKIGPILARAEEIAIPVIVLGEYRYGIGQSRHRLRYEKWLTETLTQIRVLAIDSRTASEYAKVRRDLKETGRPIPANDAWIAAIARQHKLPLISKDGHFDFVPGLQRIGW